MIEPKNVTFPITLTTFTALQKAELGRELDPAEIEFFSAVVQMANDAYTAACIGDTDVTEDLITSINHINCSDATTQHYAALCRGWVLLACRRGLELLASVSTMPS